MGAVPIQTTTDRIARLWRRTNSPLLAVIKLPVALHLGVEPCEISPVHDGMSTGVVTVRESYLGSHTAEIFMGVASLSYVEETVSAAGVLVPQLLDDFYSVFFVVP